MCEVALSTEPSDRLTRKLNVINLLVCGGDLLDLR